MHWRVSQRFRRADLRENSGYPIDFLIGCVDSRAARSVIARSLVKSNNRTAYWLDLGNNSASGQFVLGQPWNARNRRSAERLRTVNELYRRLPTLRPAKTASELLGCRGSRAPGAVINQTLAASALTMLARLLRYERSAPRRLLNAATGKVTALPVDPELCGRPETTTIIGQEGHVMVVIGCVSYGCNFG